MQLFLCKKAKLKIRNCGGIKVYLNLVYEGWLGGYYWLFSHAETIKLKNTSFREISILLCFMRFCLLSLAVPAFY